MTVKRFNSRPGLAASLLFFGAALIASDASAQAFAPWFDSNGFYNKPAVSQARAMADITVCRAEAVRVRDLRATASPTATSTGFRPDGTYDPVAGAAAAGIANIITAIQDASYADSLVPKEFRDCTVSLGYRKFTLDTTARMQASDTPDRGFADLVAADTPAQGKPYNGAGFGNYYDAIVATPPFVPAAADPAAIVEGPVPAVPTEPLPKQFKYGTRADEPGDIQPVAPGQIATAGDGMAIVVMSVRQSRHVAADGVVRVMFRRVSQDGQFVGLLDNTTHFTATSFVGGRGVLDPTLKGDITAPRYSTFVVPAGRYAIRTAGLINTCLGTLTFAVRPGEVVYLGDLTYQDAGLPLGAMLNPFSNVKKDMDKDIKANTRFAIGGDLEGARTALLGDADAKAKLTPAAYENGYRIPCDGRYVGRIANPAWPGYDPAQMTAFNDAMAQKIAEAPKK